VKTLLSAKGIDVNQDDKNGNTALMIACQDSDDTGVFILFWIMQTKCGVAMFYYYVSSLFSITTVVELLLKARADLNRSNMIGRMELP